MDDRADERVGAQDPTERLNTAMRLWSAAFSDLGRRFGVHLAMHSSDAAALVQITAAEDQGEPLTQTRLARQIGLTAPATSALLSRLEAAGHIERRRDRADRRVVTLRSTARMHEQVHAFFGEVGRDIDRVIEGRPAAVVDELTAMVQEMTDVMRRHVEDLTTGARAGAATGGRADER